MARLALSEQSERKALRGKPANKLTDTDKGVRLSSSRPQQQDPSGWVINDRVGRGMSHQNQGTRLDVRDVKFRTKNRSAKINEPLPVRSNAMPAYKNLRGVLTDDSTIYMNDIGRALDGHEKYGSQAFDVLDKDATLDAVAGVDARKKMIGEYLKMPGKEQLNARMNEVRKALKGLNATDRDGDAGKILRAERNELAKRLNNIAREEARPGAEAHAAFATSLMDALDQKNVTPDLEEMEGRLAGIQAATTKLNRYVIGDKKAQDLRARATKYQQTFATQKAAEAAKPREAGAADFARLEAQMAQFRKMVGSENDLREPQKVRARINELRKDVHALSHIPRATQNPRYEALLQELNEGELALVAMEGDELAQLLQDVGEAETTLDTHATPVNRDGAASTRPDAIDAAMNRAQNVGVRLREAYDDSDARFAPEYRNIKNRLAAVQNRVEVLRNPVLSPRIEAHAIVPERVNEIPEIKEGVELVEESAAAPKNKHTDLLNPMRSIEWQVAEAEIQSNDRTARVLALEEQIQAAKTANEKNVLGAELVHAAHLQEVALKREFIVLSAEPHEMAKSLDKAAEMHTRILDDEIGQEVVAKIRALEAEGQTLDTEMVRSFKDAEEAAYARKWLSVRRTSKMVEEGISHLREYHESQLKLLELRDRLVVECEKCFIPPELRAELMAAVTPAERRHLVDSLLADPEAMDRVQTPEQFLMKGALVFNRMFKALGLPHSDREYANKDLDTLVKTLGREHHTFNELREGRLNFGNITPPGAHVEVRAASDAYTLGDPLASPPETEGPFQLFMSISERAGRLITDMKAFNGEVTDKVVARFNSRLRDAEDDMGTYAETPNTVKSVFDLAQAKLTDARQELAKLQQKQAAANTPVPGAAPRATVSPDNLGMIEQNVSASRETIADLQKVEDRAEELLDQVNEALNDDRTMGEGEFNTLDRDAIVLSARLRTMQNHKGLSAFETADRAVKKLNTTLDRYEERTIAADRTNMNRPIEVLLKTGVVAGLKGVAGNGPKRAALSHYLIELNGGEGVRVDRPDDVQDVLLTFLGRYSTMHPIEQRQAERSFAKVAELLNFTALYRDLGVINLNQLAARLTSKIDLAQAPANERGSEGPDSNGPDEIEDLLAEFDASQPVDNTKLAA